MPIVLAYPKVYARLMGSPSEQAGLQKTLAKCFELSQSRPQYPGEQTDSHMGLDEHQALFTIWSSEADEPDIFILAGWGDGFGPGHSCPEEEALRSGDYDPLTRVPFFL